MLNLNNTKITVLSSRITSARQEAGLSQRQLAKELGVSKRSIKRWESGKHKVDPIVVSVISHYFDKPENWFAGGWTQ